jgi:hypothetical protein
MTKTNLDKLARVQHLGLLNVANMRKGTQTAALEIAYGVEPLDLYLREAAAQTFVRLGQPTGCTDSGHLAKLNKMIPAHCRNCSYGACTPIRVWEKNFKTDINHGVP